MADKDAKTELRITRLMALLPYGLVVGLARALAWLASLLPLSLVSAHRHIVVNQLACFPEKNYRQVRRLARRTLIETAHTLASYSHVWLRPADETLARVRAMHGVDEFNAALEADRPVLLLSLHQSAWELPGLALGTVCNAMLMYQPTQANAMDAVVKAARERTGGELVPTNTRGVRRALALLNRGGVLGLLADHQPGGKQNPWAPFFGHQVQVPAFVHKVIARYQPAVFYLSARRVPGSGDELFFEPAPGDMLKMDETQLLARMMADLEAIIRCAPAQYNWTYARFRRGPHGKRRWYKKADALALIERCKAGEPAHQVFADAGSGMTGVNR